MSDETPQEATDAIQDVDSVPEPIEASEMVESTDDDVENEAPTFVVMHIAMVAFELPSPSPVVHLQEAEMPHRSIEIPVGLPEAQALASAISHVDGVRPTTHELFTTVLRDARIDVVAIRVTDCINGVYFGELDLMSSRGRTVLDCRPTDGLILAMRQGVPAPILCDERLLDQE